MNENEYIYGQTIMSDEPCVVCGRTNTLLLPYGDDGLACVECLCMENGETEEDNG